jgi:peroxiredoxin
MLQVVDLQKSREFEALGVELLSISPDSVEAWQADSEQYGLTGETPVLSDQANRVASAYDVMRWQAATGEPGHTFVLVDEEGMVAWIKDYGAPKNGGLMYVVPDELVPRIAAHVLNVERLLDGAVRTTGS